MEQKLQQLEEALVPARYQGSGSGAEAKRWKGVWGQRLLVVVLVFSDLLLALLVWEGASLLQAIWGGGQLSVISALAIVPTVTVWLGMRGMWGLYPGYGLDSVEELRRHTFALFATLAVLAVLVLGFQVGDQLSRLLLVLFFLGLLVLAPFARQLVKKALKVIGPWGRPVIIFSSGQDEDREGGLPTLLQERWQLGYKPVAVFDFQLGQVAPAHLTPIHQSYESSYKETLASAADLARKRAVTTAVFAMPQVGREQLAEIVNLASLNFRHILVIPNLSGVTNSATVARNLAGTLAVEVKYNLLNIWVLRAKRIFDLSATLAGGILILPLILTLCLLLYLESGGPIIYRDQRMGRNGKLFWCLKFRTMVPNAEALLQRMLQEDVELKEEYAKYHKLRVDPRITRIGRFLRRTSLDELPQLWNVLRGEMSLVGPRPYLPRESEEIGMTQSEILRVPPGITGLWQVSGRNHARFVDRVQIDANYVRDWSIWLDVVLLARTAKALFIDRGAY